jgi:hypothetical protein
MRIAILILVSLWRLMVSVASQVDQSSIPSSVTPIAPRNIVIFSATGRVGSTNLLSMFRGRLKNIGEIFISFRSKNLPPDPSSPLTHPSDDNHRRRIDAHIRRAFVVTNPNIHLVASIKFWHAWSNGVTVSWLAKALITNGAVTHFILISRNPTRITVSEQYGHRHHSWSYPKGSSTSGNSPVCARSYLSYHIGGRWMSQMAVKHYRAFLEILSLLPQTVNPSSVPSLLHHNSSSSTTSPLAILGLSYEADILRDPLNAYRQIISFLALSDTNLLVSSQLPSSKYGKGMSCALSSMLINYEEILCTFLTYDHRNTDTEPISWMATDNDQDNGEVTFSQMMRAWKGLAESSDYQKEGFLSECSLEEILSSLPALRLRSPVLRNHSAAMMSTSARRYGICAVDGHQLPSCPPHSLEAIPSDRVNDFCAFALARSECDWATIHKGRCSLHSNRTTTKTEQHRGPPLRFESCDADSFTVRRQERNIAL